VAGSQISCAPRAVFSWGQRWRRASMGGGSVPCCWPRLRARSLARSLASRRHCSAAGVV